MIVSGVLAGGVIGFVPNEALAPVGTPAMLNVTGELNPFNAFNCVVKIADCPCTVFCDDGVVET